MCFDCNWAKIAKHIDEMLEDREKYGFAAEFLESVRRQARQKSHITPRQAEGVRNVWRGANKAKAKPDADDRNPRRYEGFDPSRHN